MIGYEKLIQKTGDEFNMRFIVTFLFVVCATSLHGNLITNSDFAQVKANRLPEKWEFRGSPDNISIGKGVVSLTEPTKSTTMLIQQIDKLDPAKNYQLSFEVNAPKNLRYFVYFENYDGKKYQNSFGKIESGNADWTKKQISVSIPAGTRWSRVVIRIMSPGRVHFRNFQLQEEVEELSNHGLNEIPESYAKDILYNGNIERGARHWELVRNSSIIRTNENLGNYAMKVDGNGLTGQSGISFVSGREYKLTYFVKAVSEKEPQGYQVNIRFPENIVFGKEESAMPGNYQSREIVFTAPGELHSVIRGDIACSSNKGAGIILDEFFLAEIKPEEKLPVKMVVSTPHNGSRIFASDPIAAIEGDFSGSPEVKDVELKLLNEAKTPVYTRKLQTSSGRFSIPASSLEEGRYTIQITPFDITGKQLAKTERSIRKLPPAKHEVVIRSDNNFYIDGKVFFPIFMGRQYDAKNSNIMTYFSARNGINGTMGADIGSSMEHFNKLQQYGMKTIFSFQNKISAPSWRLPPEEFIKVARQVVDRNLTPEIMQNPALLAYDIYDEPLGNDVPHENFRIVCDLVREKDPYHPILYTEAPRGVTREYVRKYADGTDLIGTDLYPVVPSIRHSSLADKDITGVGAYVKMLSSFVDNRKPVQIWIQAFNWKELSNVPGGRMPTLAETRFMNYDALTHGVTMLIYYNDRNFNSDYYQNILFPATREIASMFGVFRLGEIINKVDANAPVEVWAREYQNQRYMIVLNRSMQEQQGVISGITPNGKWNVLGENRSIEVAAGKLSDTFAPFAVHVYSTSTEFPKATWEIPPQDPENEKNKNNLFDLFLARNPALQGANWIWYPGEEMTDFSKITAIKNFSVKGEVKSAKLYASADNFCTVFLNSKKVCENKSWNQITPVNIAPLLKDGDNQLKITAGNQDGRCGLLVALEITYQNGQKERIVSDSTWETINSKSDSKKALSIVPYGQGAWLTRVQITGE